MTEWIYTTLPDWILDIEERKRSCLYHLRKEWEQHGIDVDAIFTRERVGWVKTTEWLDGRCTIGLRLILTAKEEEQWSTGSTEPALIITG